ncbi:hypothetical protein F5Y15DRAFT_420293 [Xylariaceae sp. FL0016]|nr:hypothetical protein F5Y15DRAFT_420293 [Xylariaceae sp. FL0016]
MAFEIHPETLVVMLIVRTKSPSTVTASAVDENEYPQETSGDCAILYGQAYKIKIASYVFRLAWNSSEPTNTVQYLKDTATSDYQDALHRLKDVRSRDHSVLGPESAQSYYMTRIRSSKAPLVKEIKEKRDNIIECLGAKDFATDEPLIFMPFRQGHLRSLFEEGKCNRTIYTQVLRQMLSALDYLAFENYCHRDVKPVNILYYITE